MQLQCQLCPKYCVLRPGQAGECRVRVNLDGKLVATTYGFPCSVHIDPVEKKPVFHFLPGTGILSLATVGCNLRCKNCQNWQISQRDPVESSAYELPAEQVGLLARQQKCSSIALTYTEPIVFYEYTRDCCISTHEQGLKTAIISAGYINQKPWRALCEHLDTVKVDLKSMSDQFYRDICGGSLQPVLDTLVTARELGKMIEVVNLVIPTLNDSDQDLTTLSRWVVKNLGKEVPIHFSRFHPNYQMRNLPLTPPETLIRAREIAQSEGLHYVYIGNIAIPGAEDTVCPGCQKTLIRRQRYTILLQEVTPEGRCPACHHEIYGIWQ